MSARRGSDGSVTRETYDAVLLDLDGVITDTARIHAKAWKRMFDEYLRSRSSRTGEPFRPFDLDEDYARYTDGKARRDGVRDFLASRDIRLAEGSPDALPDEDSVAGIAHRGGPALETQGNTSDKACPPFDPATSNAYCTIQEWITRERALHAADYTNMAAGQTAQIVYVERTGAATAGRLEFDTFQGGEAPH